MCRMRHIVYSFSLLALAAAVVGVACGDNNGNQFPTIPDEAGTTDDSGDPILPGSEAGDAVANCTTCSGDLHNILTCGDNPQVVQTCTGDQGCGPSGCVPACEAAAANKSSIGCDYYAIPSDAWSTTYNSGGAAGNCFAAFVTNNWTAPMKVTLVWKGKTIDATPYSYIPKGSGNSITYSPVPGTGIPANSMAIVFLNQTQGGGGLKVQCPSSVKAAIENEDMVLHGTNIGHAMEIQTSVPAVVYDIYPYGGATSYISSATLLLPTTAWDTNYVAVTMAEEPTAFPPGIDLIAQQDGTKITLLPSTNITAANGVAGASKGVPVSYTINKGQTIHLMEFPDNSGNDLSGSIVQSNNPIGVWGEHFCMTQPDPPKWRILGAVNGTTLTYDPPVSGAPKTIKLGQLVEFDGPEAFHVQSQDNMHPFYFAGHRPGGDCDAAHQQIPPIQALGYEYAAVANEITDYGVGGPETVNIVPPAQFLSSYIFFTDPTYGYTDLALVRKKATDGTFKDVTLDCLGKVGGWKPIGGSAYQYTHVDVQHANAPVGKCDNGLHTIKSDAPLGITVWGYDSASSYAYPAGASVKPINSVVVPPVPN
jgi:IgGFc binding protein